MSNESWDTVYNVVRLQLSIWGTVIHRSEQMDQWLPALSAGGIIPYSFSCTSFPVWVPNSTTLKPSYLECASFIVFPEKHSNNVIACLLKPKPKAILWSATNMVTLFSRNLKKKILSKYILITVIFLYQY